MRIVMVTTEVEMSQVALALGAGADEYIMKPFTDEILRDKLGMLGLCVGLMFFSGSSNDAQDSAC